jgi:hypothetical protein
MDPGLVLEHILVGDWDQEQLLADWGIHGKCEVLQGRCFRSSQPSPDFLRRQGRTITLPREPQKSLHWRR